MDATNLTRQSDGTKAPSVRARRAAWLGVILALFMLLPLALAVTGSVQAQDDPTATATGDGIIVSTEVGSVPSAGGARPGPVNALPPTSPRAGALPVGIRIAKAQVDATVETVQIVDGAMQDPTGPFVVSWYKETAKLGQRGNAVMAGHLDYWDVGEAVFYNLDDVVKGDEIEVTGEDGKVYKYMVDWTKLYQSNADAEAIQEIVGETPVEALTLITCGGPFDFDNGVYLQRFVVRALRAR